MKNKNPIFILNAEGKKLPLIFIHPVGGQVYWYRDLAKAFGKDHPVYVFMSPGLINENYSFGSIEQMANDYNNILINKILN